MGFLDRFKLALQGVSSNKFRSFLTLLGIIIGVGAVILMVSLGSGTQQVVSGQFNNLSKRQIYLSSNYNMSYRQRGQLSLEDESYLEGAVIGVKDIVPFYRAYNQIKYSGKTTDNTVAGVLPGAIDLSNLTLKYGREIEADDVQGRQRVAVVGEEVLENLIKQDDYFSFIGKKILVDNHKFTIIGILGKSNSTLGLSNQVVLVPLTTYQDVWRAAADQGVSYYLISYLQNARESDIIAQVNYLLDRKYGRAGGESRFMLQGLQSQLDVISRVLKVFTLVLGGIAAISLLVGGIGVMNIMLVTVKERTREIGLRLAIGATRKDIQMQFLLEAITLTVGGGLLGVLCGSGLSMLASLGIRQFYDWWQGGIPLWIVFLSFGVTVLIGLIFGFYPAYKASKLDPIEALRYE